MRPRSDEDDDRQEHGGFTEEPEEDDREGTARLVDITHSANLPLAPWLDTAWHNDLERGMPCPAPACPGKLHRYRNRVYCEKCRNRWWSKWQRPT